MTISKLVELREIPIGTILDAKDVEFTFPLQKRKPNRWQTVTKGYGFKPGDVFVIDDLQKNFVSFQHYIRNYFSLGVRRVIDPDKGKTFCQMYRIKKKPSALRRTKKQSKVDETDTEY